MSRARKVALLVVLLIPRIARLLYPQLWIEDESYLNVAFELSRGARPYLDLPLQHFPLLDWLMAGAFRVFGASIATAEVLTALAAFASSWLIFRIGRRLDGSAAGIAAATIFACSSLVFRYHVYERELFLLVPVLLATELALAYTEAKASAHDRTGSASRSGVVGRRFSVGLLLALAIAFKQTAWSAVAAIAIYLWWSKRTADARTVVVGALALIAALTLALFFWAGDRFFTQVVLFGWRHAVTPIFSIKVDELRASTDLPLALGAGGVVALFLARGPSNRLHRGFGGQELGPYARAWRLPLLQIAIATVILVVLKPVYWAHNGLELLPWLSLTGGFLIARAIARQWSVAFFPAAIAGSLLLTVVPIKNLNWEAGAGSVYGFGYRDRAEIADMAAFVAQRSTSDARVAVPPLLAFVANRREFVPYPELNGRMQELQGIVDRQGRIGTLLSGVEKRTFWDEVDASRQQWMPQLFAAIRERRVPVVINSSEDDLFPIPLIAVPEPVLMESGYAVGKSTAHYRAWVPATP